MGGNCATCNCNRDEHEAEIKLEQKLGHGGQKVLSADQNQDNVGIAKT